MTITFTKGPFKIKDFIENKINGSYGEEPDSFQLSKEFEKKGLSYEESRKRFLKKIKEFEKEKKKFVKGKIEKQKVLGSSFAENVNKIIGSSNSFIYSAWDAYNYHHHLEIRPDNIWMAIISQFSLYLNKYNKELQDKFIDFQIENNEKKN
ncbi:hypothetical protein ACTFIZ_003724 [Dictyostelium cf. discoideum]